MNLAGNRPTVASRRQRIRKSFAGAVVKALAFVLVLPVYPFFTAPPAYANVIGTGSGLFALLKNGAESYATIPTDMRFSDRCGSTVLATVDFDWSTTMPTGTSCGTLDGSFRTNYSAMITGYLLAPATGNFTFKSRNDDGFVMNLNGQTVLSSWTGQGAAALPNYNATSSAVSLVAGNIYPLRIFFAQGAGSGEAHLYWNYGSGDQIIPQSNLGLTASDLGTGCAVGESQFCPADNARQIKAINGTTSNQKWWINVGGVSTNTYALMDSNIDGGGWMMGMKGVTNAQSNQTTFQYDSSHWTTNSTVQLGSDNNAPLASDDANGKNNVFNYSAATEALVIWRDLTGRNDGFRYTNAGTYGFTWKESLTSSTGWSNPAAGGVNASGGCPTTAVTLLVLFTNANRCKLRAASSSSPYDARGSTVFSSQNQIDFFGFNYYGSGATPAKKARFGFGWNENEVGNEGSNDVVGGIGLGGSSIGAWGAGDFIGCCQVGTSGINRQAGFEFYVRNSALGLSGSASVTATNGTASTPWTVSSFGYSVGAQLQRYIVKPIGSGVDMSKISINSSTGAVSVASDIAGGTYNLAVSMIDTYGQVASSKFTLTVADANLSSLAISAGTLAPVFTPGTTSYTATVSHTVSSMTVTPTAVKSNATYKTNVNSAGLSSAINSGTTSGSLALNNGSNTILVVVTDVNGSTTTTYTLTVTRTTAQTITRTSTSPTSPVVGATHTPTATASSGLSVAITIAAGSSSICAISSGVVTFNAAGSCVIQYNQAGNASFSAATQVTETLTIGKATPTFSAWSNVSKTFGDSPFTVTAPTVTGALAGSFTYSSATTSVISISGTTLTVAGGGSSVITATFTPTDTANYNSATTTMTVTVAPATQTVTWAPTTALSTTASPSTPSSLATALGSATIAYSVTNAGTTGCAVDSSTGVLTFTSAGSCIVRASAAATSNYAAATRDVTFVISLATRTLAIDSGSFTSSYTMIATPPTLTSTASAGGGTKSYASSTLSVCTINSSTGVLSFVAVGTCTITASIAADATYESATSTSISFTTTLATQTVTWAPTTALTTTATPATPSSLATALGGATISYSVTNAGATGCTVDSSTAVLTFTSAGSCTVRASAAETSNYAAATKDVTFVIAQATRTITVTQGANGEISPGTTSLNYGSNQSFTFTPATGYSVASITVDGVALTGSALTTAIASGYTFTNVIEARTLAATYSINTFTITFNRGANGSGSNQTATKTFGIALTLPNSATANGYFTRSGYTVTGWTTTDGSAQTHALAASFTTESVTTLYPVWSARTDNAISYNNQGATTAQSGGSTTYTTGAAIATIPLVPPIKIGFAFKGWYTTESSGTQVTNGSYTPPSPYGAITLYAQWNSSEANLSSLTISAGALSPNFGSNTIAYTASVANTVDSGYTITATKSQSNASVVQYRGATGTTEFDGSLNIGANVIRITVTAQDGITTKTYTLTVTRAATPPTASVINPSINAEFVQPIRVTFLQTSPIAAQVNTPSRVTFLANNKAISGCTAVRTVAGSGTNTATCKYRPTSLGSITISVTILPNSSDFLSATRSIRLTVSPK